MIPPFRADLHLLEPWQAGQAQGSLWIVLTGFFLFCALGWLGTFLMLRRQTLLSDAISHSLLPGVAAVFLFTGSRDATPMLIGGLVAGLLTVLLIEVLDKVSKLHADAATGVVFSSLFALGVLMISLNASSVDLDLDCVLYGELGTIPLSATGILFGVEVPWPVQHLGVLWVATLIFLTAFFKEWQVSTFDPGLSVSLGLSPKLHNLLQTCLLSIAIVLALKAVGAVMVIATTVFPPATARLLTDRLSRLLCWVPVLAAINALLGFHLALWLNCNFAGAMTVAAAMVFIVAWIFGPLHGLLWKGRPRKGVAPVV